MMSKEYYLLLINRLEFDLDCFEVNLKYREICLNLLVGHCIKSHFKRMLEVISILTYQFGADYNIEMERWLYEEQQRKIEKRIKIINNVLTT